MNISPNQIDYLLTDFADRLFSLGISTFPIQKENGGYRHGLIAPIFNLEEIEQEIAIDGFPLEVIVEEDFLKIIPIID